MATVWIPSLLRDLTGGVSEVSVTGATVREIVDALEARYPGMKERLCEDDRLRPNIAVVIDGSRSRKGLREVVGENNEVHFIPAMAGGI